jgi:hypothetical protein
LDSKKEFGSPLTELNQSGFGSILLLSLLPVFMASIVALLLGFATQQNLMAGRHICRSKNIEFQRQSAESLSSLLAFNPKIHILRLEETTLKIQLAAAVASQNFAAIVTAQQRLKVARQQLASIDLSQQTILKANRVLSEQFKYSLPAMILKQNRHNARLAPYIRISFSTPKVDIKSIAVTPDRPGTLAPIYEPHEPFIQSQSSQAFWNVQISIDQTHKLYPWLSSQVKWREACGASLRKEGSQWIPILVNASRGRF